MFNRIAAFFSLLFFFGLFFSAPAFSCDIDGQTGIAPDNNLWIPADIKSAGMSEQDFNRVIDKVENIYSPVIKQYKKKLVIKRYWENGTVNAMASQFFTYWNVMMFGGLARHPAITKDGLALVVCHEIGHHLGGQPRKKQFFIIPMWASNEGQADYFATSKCLRKYMEDDDNISIMADVNVPEYVTQKCSDNFADIEEIAMCERGAMAGLSVSKLFVDLRKLSTDVHFHTPDEDEVSRTYHGHPAPQCRLDTYFAGALCNRDHTDDVSSKYYNLNVCNRYDGDIDGLRPLCWYKPKEDGEEKPWWKVWNEEHPPVHTAEVALK